MFGFLLSLVFGLHLLAVDVATVGPLLAMWLEWRQARRGDPLAGAIGRRLAAWSLACAVFGIGLGLISVALLPGGEASPYRSAFARVPEERWWFVASELVFYAVVMGIYVGLWRRLTSSRGGRVVHRLLAILASTNFLYHFPPLFVVISALSARPDLWQAPFDRRLYWTLLLENESLARVAHHWLASLAVAGCAAMLVASGLVAQQAADAARNSARTIIRLSARIALVATVLQMPVGAWVLIAAQPVTQESMLGEDALATGLFVVSIIAALALMHHLAAAMLSDVSRRAIWRTAALMALVVILMAATLHRSRQAALDELRPHARLRSTP